MMFQDHALFPHLDVCANVAFGLRMQGRSRSAASERVGELLELVGLPGSEHRSVQTLSGGEQQRVALARSLAPSPGLLLLDEPLGALDRPLRERLVVELRQLVGRLGLTMVAVTHDQAEAFALADRLAVVDHGTVLQCGPPATLWRAPASQRVARLLGFSNVVPVSRDRDRLVTPWGDTGPVDGAPVAVVIRPEGVHIDPDGPIVGTVISTTFAGARTRIWVAVDGAPDLEAEVPGAHAPAVGDVIHLSIDPASMAPLPS
jgi:thiamine transport system ATP-binding protein